MMPFHAPLAVLSRAVLAAAIFAASGLSFAQTPPPTQGSSDSALSSRGAASRTGTLADSSSLQSSLPPDSQFDGFNLPTQYTKASDELKPRICGEILTALAVTGASAKDANVKPAGKNSQSRRDVAEFTATQAVLYLGETAGLTLPQKQKARDAAHNIEAQSVELHLSTAFYCTALINKRVERGDITADDVLVAHDQAKLLLVHVIGK